MVSSWSCCVIAVSNKNNTWLYAAAKMYICYGCGSDIEKNYDRRLLDVPKSKHVLSLWKSLVDVSVVPGFMCRGCFSTYERYIALKEKIEANLAKAIDKIPSGQPKRMRLQSSISASTSYPSPTHSPDVGICKITQK